MSSSHAFLKDLSAYLQPRACVCKLCMMKFPRCYSCSEFLQRLKHSDCAISGVTMSPDKISSAHCISSSPKASMTSLVQSNQNQVLPLSSRPQELPLLIPRILTGSPVRPDPSSGEFCGADPECFLQCFLAKFFPRSGEVIGIIDLTPH